MSAHNFADDNILSSFARSVKMLLKILVAESENPIKLFSDNWLLTPTNLNLSFKKKQKKKTIKPK